MASFASRVQDEELPALLDRSGTASPGSRWYFPARYALALLLFFGLANVYALRVNLSMAIVCMTHQPEDPPGAGEFHWSNDIQGIVLGSFYYGYILTQIPGGWIATCYGGKVVFGVGVLTTTILTLVTPVAARLSVWALVVVRVLEGIGEGVTFPALHGLWAKWAPPAERSRLTTLSLAGPHFGTVFSMPVSGWLCRHGFGRKSSEHYHGDEWPSVFYVFGSVGMLWCLLWFLLAADSPAGHPRISKRERLFIESSLEKEEKTPVGQHVPWKALFSSGPVWAIVVGLTCSSWGFYVMLSCLPMFMKDVLGFDLVTNGLYSALPYLTFGVLVPIFGWLADYVRSKWLSTEAVRKIFTVVGFLSSALFLVLTSYTTSPSVAVVYLVFSVGLVAIAISGVNVNPLDIAPRYAGVVMGLSNMAATVPGIIAPVVADAMTTLPYEMNNSVKMETLRMLWRQVFFISAEINAFGAFFYVAFASGTVQHWAGGMQSSLSVQQCSEGDRSEDDE